MTHKFMIEVDDEPEMGLQGAQEVQDVIWEAIRGTGLDNNARITIVADSRVRELEDAIRKFLTAGGHDLCHVNRRDLARVLGDSSVSDALPYLVTRAEFEEGCRRYADEIYGAEKRTTKCVACDGCGKVANDEDRSPWTRWESLPPGSDLAVKLGLVRPETCDACGGTGEILEADKRGETDGRD